jgi:hypothetical protein
MHGPQLADQKSNKTSSLPQADCTNNVATSASAGAAGNRPKGGRTIRSLHGLVVGVPPPRRDGGGGYTWSPGSMRFDGSRMSGIVPNGAGRVGQKS